MAATEGAYIDLKTVDFFLEDGFSKDGSVNFMAGYAIGVTVLTVLFGANVVIPNGVIIKFAGHDTEYSVTAHTETSGSTTSITISPALTDAVVDDEVIHAGPNRLTVKIGDGNLTYDEKVAREYKMDRGRLDQVRNGDQAPIDVEFAFAFIYITAPTGAVVPTFEDFIKRRGPAAAYVSTGGDCEPYAVNIVMLNNSNSDTCDNIDDPREKITLPKFYYESLKHDPKAGTVSCSGKCNALEAIVERLPALDA